MKKQGDSPSRGGRRKVKKHSLPENQEISQKLVTPQSKKKTAEKPVITGGTSPKPGRAGSWGGNSRSATDKQKRRRLQAHTQL